MSLCFFFWSREVRDGGESGKREGGRKGGGAVRSASKFNCPLWRAARARGSVIVDGEEGSWESDSGGGGSGSGR